MPDKPRKPTRSFTPSVKQAAISRLEAGEALAAVARDVGISRQLTTSAHVATILSVFYNIHILLAFCFSQFLVLAFGLISRFIRI
jgi:hypothetical protein